MVFANKSTISVKIGSQQMADAPNATKATISRIVNVYWLPKFPKWKSKQKAQKLIIQWWAALN